MKMQTAQISNYGDVDLLLVNEAQVPKITASQVLIKVQAAGVNPVDCYIRQGMFKDSGTHTLPLTLGWDASGIIDAIGDDTEGFAIGDEVFVFSPFEQNGAYAQYLAVEANLVVAKPKNLNFAQSAAVPLAAVTAWQALFSEGKLQAGQRVLIHNTSGGVGSFAVQLAKAAGAYVIGTASEKNREYVESLGVDEFIDYQTSTFENEVDPVDLVFAAVGGNDVVARSLSIIKPNGYLISALDEIDEALAVSKNVNYLRLWVQPNAKDLGEIKQLIEAGKVIVKIDSTYPLSEVQQAHQRSETKRAVGKIVIDIASH